MTFSRSLPIRPATAIVVASLAATLWYALARGQDFNWDQRNYHIGVPFLLAHGTFWSSIAPAGIQSYFNPYVLQAQFFGLAHLPAPVFAILLAAVQSTGFMIAGFMCMAIARDAPGESQARADLLGLLGFALCLMAPLALSEAGTTFIDLITAAPIIGAYALLLRRDRQASRAWLMAGLLLGAATALKLTNGVFAFGALGFALAGPETRGRRLGMLILCGAAALVAFLAVGGPWQLGLWLRFRNPFFPYYNNIFHSPDFGQTALRDERFLPHSVLDIWRYPLYWLLGGSPRPGIASPSAELHFIDARWITITFGGGAFLTALAILPRWRRRVLHERATGVLLAVLLTYLIWLAEFGIQRYMIPIEMLGGAAVLVLVLQLPWPRIRLALTAVFTLLCFFLLAVPDWGHVPWRSYWRAVNPQPLAFGSADADSRQTIVFLTMKPSSYVIASLPPDARYVGISGDFDLHGGVHTRLARQLGAMLAADPPPRLKEVDPGSVPGVAAEMLASRGLRVGTHCQPLAVASETFRVCDVERAR